MAHGFKSGGRKKGTKNKKTQRMEESALKVIETVLGSDKVAAFEGDAHALLMTVYKNVGLPLGLRLDAAKAAIRYEKAQLAAVTLSGSLQVKRAEEMTDDELAAIAASGGIGADPAPLDKKQLN